MSKLQQAAYGVRDLIYTLALALFGWTLVDFPHLMAKPLDSIASFFIYSWGAIFTGLTLIGFLVDLVFCPGQIHPKDEDPKPWRRWRGMLMEANLVPSIFCDHFDVLQISQHDIFRVLGVFLYALSLALATWFGTNRKSQIDQFGDDSYSTKGIYSRVRYPQYLVQLIYSLSVPLIFNSWIGWVATGLLLIYQIRFLRGLDKKMEKKYSRDWVIYRQKTKSLIPFIV